MVWPNIISLIGQFELQSVLLICTKCFLGFFVLISTHFLSSQSLVPFFSERGQRLWSCKALQHRIFVSCLSLKKLFDILGNDAHQLFPIGLRWQDWFHSHVCTRVVSIFTSYFWKEGGHVHFPKCWHILIRGRSRHVGGVSRHVGGVAMLDEWQQEKWTLLLLPPARVTVTVACLLLQHDGMSFTIIGSYMSIISRWVSFLKSLQVSLSFNVFFVYELVTGWTHFGTTHLGAGDFIDWAPEWNERTN